MEGARWDIVTGSIADSHLKDLFPAMPVLFIKAVTQDKQDTKNVYECPVFKIRFVSSSLYTLEGLIYIIYVAGCADQLMCGPSI